MFGCFVVFQAAPNNSGMSIMRQLRVMWVLELGASTQSGFASFYPFEGSWTLGQVWRIQGHWFSPACPKRNLLQQGACLEQLPSRGPTPSSHRKCQPSETRSGLDTPSDDQAVAGCWERTQKSESKITNTHPKYNQIYTNKLVGEWSWYVNSKSLRFP